MEIKDQNIIFKTPGKQLSFILLMMVWAIVLTALAIELPIERLAKLILGCITAFLAIYFLGYALILTRKIVEKYYK